MKSLMIDDQPEGKIYDMGLEGSDMVIAKTVAEGIALLDQSPQFSTVYLDCRLPDGTHRDVLDWLSDHLDKVPMEIRSCSFATFPDFYPRVYTLLKIAERLQKDCRKDPV